MTLTKLQITRLKELAKKHNPKVQGTIEEDWLETRRLAPTKNQYISKLANVVTEKELTSLAQFMPIKKEVKTVRTRALKSNTFF